MPDTLKIILCCLLVACCSSLLVIPVQAFTANSLDITIEKNGDAIATFRYTLEGIIENSIPQSMLEDELRKGLTTSTEPPELVSMDRSGAVLRLKKFAATSDVPTGTSYLTASLDFKKAEIALKNSALSGVVSADFSPEKIVLTFPDAYSREFTNADVLPAVSHIVTDPSKIQQTPTGVTTGPSSGTGSMNVTSSPMNVDVYLDSGYIGESPSVFTDIPSGTHTIGFRKEGFESVSKNVTILAGKTIGVQVILRTIPPATMAEGLSFPGTFWVGVLVVLISLAVGGYYFWSEKKRKEDWE